MALLSTLSGISVRHVSPDLVQLQLVTYAAGEVTCWQIIICNCLNLPLLLATAVISVQHKFYSFHSTVCRATWMPCTFHRRPD